MAKEHKIHGDIGQELDDIERTQITPELLAALTSEDGFNRIAVELLVETGCYVCVAACILPAHKNGWNRNEAIIGGNVVRLYKLLSAMLDQTCQHRRETTFVFARLAYEAIVNIRYLIKHPTEEVFDSYVRYSLRHEKKLHDRILRNIEARNNSALPIEERMLRSIRKVAEKSEVSLDLVTGNSRKNWADKNLFQRAEAVGLEDAYLAAFGGGSHSIHGNWMDLVEYHLDSEGADGFFQPCLEWRHPRPQALFMIAQLTIETLREYFGFVGGGALQQLVEPPLHDLWERNLAANIAHEKFVSGMDQNPATASNLSGEPSAS